MRLEIFSVDGKRVKVLVDDFLSPGIHYYDWNGTDQNNSKVAAGLYFGRLTTALRESSVRLVLLKCEARQGGAVRDFVSKTQWL